MLPLLLVSMYGSNQRVDQGNLQSMYACLEVTAPIILCSVTESCDLFFSSQPLRAVAFNRIAGLVFLSLYTYCNSAFPKLWYCGKCE